MEELEALRKKISELELDKEYPQCIKLIEDNIKTLYEKERWPDMFFASLRAYQRCLAATGKQDALEERLVAGLKDNGVPYVFAFLLRASDSAISWNGDYFKNLAIQSERRGDFEAALSYCDIVIKLDPENSSSYVSRGWILDDLKRHKEARDMFERAVELNESNHSARNSLAKHYACSNPQLALEHAEKAIELAPGEGSYYDTKGRVMMRLNDSEGAIACYDMAIAAAPYSPDYPYQKGEILLSCGKEIAAIAQYRKAMALNDVHIPSLWRLATLYENSQPELALTYINTIISHSPDNQDAQLLRGMLLCTLGQTENAEAQFKEILEADPQKPEALGGYANLLLQKDPAAAITYYDKAIAISPKNADFHFGKARALELLEQDAQAIKEYRTVISLDSNNARAFGRLGSLLASSKPREAAEFYTKAIALMPDNAFYYASKAEILTQYPECRSEAIACFSKASELTPKNAQLHVQLAKLLEQSGNLVSAEEHYKQAVALNTDDPDAFYGLAGLILDSHPEMALLHINSAIRLNDESAAYYYLKYRVLTALGHDKNALEELERTLKADPKNAEALKEISELMRSESPDLALHYLNRAADIAPDNQDFICSRGKLYFDNKQYKNAVAQYENVLKRNAKSFDALFGVARCLFASGDDKALVFFDKALRINPTSAECRTEKAEFLVSRKKIPEALDEFEQAISLNQHLWQASLGKARILDSQDNIIEACAAYKAVLADNHNCAEAVGRLGILLSETSPTEAIGYLDHVCDLEPDEYAYHIWKGRAMLQAGNPDGAATEYHEAIRLGGESAEVYGKLAEILWEKSPETALGYCLRSIGQDDKSAHMQLLCGRIYQSLEQDGEAIVHFRAAIVLDSGCHEAYERIARIFRAHNDPGTLKILEDGLVRNPDCADCLLLKVLILDENAPEDKKTADVDEFMEIIEHAIKCAPNHIGAREKLVELLTRKRSVLKLALEKRKLAKLKAMKK